MTQRDESRDAARRRRGNENSEFNKLSQQLPLRPDITSQLRDLAVTFIMTFSVTFTAMLSMDVTRQPVTLQ